MIMRRRTTPCLFLVFLLFLSGCNTFNIGGDPSISTVTPADVPTDGPTTQDHTLAPGLTQYGVVDPVALSNAHETALSNTSYTYLKTVTETYTNGTLRARKRTEIRIVQPTRRFYLISDSYFPNVPNFDVTTRRFEIWSNGELTLLEITSGNNTTYRKHRPSDGSNSFFPDGNRFYTLFKAIDTRVVGQKMRNGRTLYRVESENITIPSVFSGGGMTNIYRNPRNITFRALIDSRGIVHEYRLAYTATGTKTNTNVTTRIVETIRYTEIGSTNVERPSWYETANQSTTPPRSR